jgi:hypothetical protein
MRQRHRKRKLSNPVVEKTRRVLAVRFDTQVVDLVVVTMLRIEEANSFAHAIPE